LKRDLIAIQAKLIMVYNSIEEELWGIFTFNALHPDPTICLEPYLLAVIAVQVVRLVRMRARCAVHDYLQ
jgi:hypothetical protein